MEKNNFGQKTINNKSIDEGKKTTNKNLTKAMIYIKKIKEYLFFITTWNGFKSFF
jgi:hypothetical protein